MKLVPSVIVGVTVFTMIVLLGIMIGHFATVDAIEYWHDQQIVNILVSADSLRQIEGNGLTQDDIEAWLKLDQLRGKTDLLEDLSEFKKRLVPLGVIPYLWKR